MYATTRRVAPLARSRTAAQREGDARPHDLTTAPSYPHVAGVAASQELLERTGAMLKRYDMEDTRKSL